MYPSVGTRHGDAEGLDGAEGQPVLERHRSGLPYPVTVPRDRDRIRRLRRRLRRLILLLWDGVDGRRARRRLLVDAVDAESVLVLARVRFGGRADVDGGDLARGVGRLLRHLHRRRRRFRCRRPRRRRRPGRVLGLQILVRGRFGESRIDGRRCVVLTILLARPRLLDDGGVLHGVRSCHGPARGWRHRHVLFSRRCN